MYRMKKPKITEGVWEVGYTTGTDGEFKDQELLGVGIIDQTPPVCVLSKKVDETELDLNNAQAISAVPDMINALIKVVKAKSLIIPTSVKEEHSGEIQALQKIIQECEDVLKKVGCTE